MSILFDNNATATLSVQAEIVDTTLTLQTNEGQLFPNPSGSDFFIATLEDTSGNIEIVTVSDNTADVLTVTRAQENTTAKVFPTGSKVELRTTAGVFNEFAQLSGAVFTGEVDLNNNVLRDPLITDGEARNIPIRGTDGGTGNQLVVPTAGGDPTIGGSVIVTVANTGTYNAASSTQVVSGEGLTGGGDLSTTRTLDFDYPGLTTYVNGGNAIQGGDYIAVYDLANTEHKKVLYQEAGIPIVNDANTSITPTDSDMNRYYRCTAATAVTFNLNTTIGTPGNVIMIEQAGAGTVTVAGTATVNTAFVTQETANQYSVIALVCTAADTWTLYGDVG